MSPRAKKYYGKVGGRAIWTIGKEAHVQNPQTQRWTICSTRQLLQFGNGLETVQHPWVNENHREVRDVKTIRQLVRDVQA